MGRSHKKIFIFTCSNLRSASDLDKSGSSVSDSESEFASGFCFSWRAWENCAAMACWLLSQIDISPNVTRISLTFNWVSSYSERKPKMNTVCLFFKELFSEVNPKLIFTVWLCKSIVPYSEKKWIFACNENLKLFNFLSSIIIERK